MFEFIQEKLNKALASLSGKGVLTETDVDTALRELRLGLLEADVALPAVKQLLGAVREKAVGEAVLRGVNPGQQVVKIVYDEVVAMLGAPAELNLNAAPPAVLLLCGLQGGGKTTTAGKLAKWLKEKHSKSVVMASLDVYRPAAIQQLAVLAERVGVPVLQSESTHVPERTTQALAFAKSHSADVLILDTAGRTDVDEALLAELKAVHATAKPVATLLVADGQTGQVAAQVAKTFNETVPLTGLVLTRMDGDARGGAALSMRVVSGKPILFLGMGEKLEALDVFRPEGIAGRILGQGDVVALVQKVQAAVAEDDTAKIEQKILKGGMLDFNDLLKQLKMMQRMGGMSGLLDLLPGMGALKAKVGEEKLAEKLNDKVIKRQQAIVLSMTIAERKKPDLLNGKRRLRIARGAGVEVSEVNKLVKMLEGLNQMAKLMKGGNLSALKAMFTGR